jgi:hypothetical protein
MYTYVLLHYAAFGFVYQEACALNVTRYLKEDGTYLFDSAPEGHSGVVVNPDPPNLDWML